MERGVRSYLSFLVIIFIAFFSIYLLHGNLINIPQTIPEIHIQLLVLLLILLDLVLVFIFYRKYKKFYFLFGIVLVVAIITPHILHGHVLISEQYAQRNAQTIVLLLNLGLFYLFYFVYRGDTKKLIISKSKTEKELLRMYEYIGQTNLKINLFNKFINFFYPASDNKKKELFNDLLMTIINSVAKADMGFIRFTNTDNGNIIKEFYYSNDNKKYTIKIPNGNWPENAEITRIKKDDKNIFIITNRYNNSRIKCTLCYLKKEDENIDIKLLKTLLNQIHLLFLINNKE